MRNVLYSLLVIVAFGSLAPAQPNLGDWVVGDSFTNHGGILYMDPTQTPPSPLTSLITMGPQGRVNSLSMHPNNRDFLVGFSTLSELALVDLNGTIVSLATIPSGAKGHVKAEDGSVFVVSGADIHRANLTTGTSTKFNTGVMPPLLNDVTIDHANGDLIAAAGLGQVLVLDAKTGATKRTLTTAIPAPYRVEHDPVSDQFFVTEGARSAWNRLDRNGTVVWTKINIGAGGLKPLEQKGTILTGASNRIAEMDTNGTVVNNQSHTYPRTTNYKFDSIEVYGSSNLSGSGSAQGGTTYSLNVSFPQAPSGKFQVAASLTGHRPGFSLPNGDIVSLATDPLFFLLLQVGSIPGLLDNFGGTLDPFGNPVGSGPTVKLPTGFPAGVRLFLQAYVLSASVPSGIALSNTWAFTTG